MFKLVSQLEITVQDKTARLILDSDTPTSVAKEMCFQIQKFIGQIEDAARAQQEADAAEKAQAQPELETITSEA
jgi:hypothetical protein